MSKFLWYCVFFCLLAGHGIAQEKSNKVQKMVELIKTRYRYRTQGQDYITDGETIAWVKYFRKWTPNDLIRLKKENLTALLFLRDAYLHNRLDILNDLIPDYYRRNGGVQAFGDDIVRISRDAKTGVCFPEIPLPIILLTKIEYYA